MRGGAKKRIMPHLEVKMTSEASGRLALFLKWQLFGTVGRLGVLEIVPGQMY